MGLLVLILQIITAIPSVIKAITAILDIIRGLKGDEKKEVQGRLREILIKHKKNGLQGEQCQESCKQEIEEYHEYLKGKYGV